MFRKLIRGMVASLVVRLMAEYRHLSLGLLKIEAAKVYLKGVRAARLSVVGMIGLLLLVALVLLGAVLVHIAFFLLLPVTERTKLLMALALGLCYCAIGIGCLLKVTSEKLWLEKSGANEVIRKATEEP